MKGILKVTFIYFKQSFGSLQTLKHSYAGHKCRWARPQCNKHFCVVLLYLHVTNNNKNNRRVYLYHRVMITSLFDLKTKRNCSVSIFSHHICKGSWLFVQFKKIVSVVCSLYRSQVFHQAGAYPGFCSMKWLGIFLLPLDGILVHRRVTPSIKFAITLLYKKGHCESEVSCPRTQCHVPGVNQGTKPDHSIWRLAS